MIHPVYTQTSSVNLTSNANAYVVMSSDQTPLIKTKYLSEFRTELEKAKVRKNLGIADDASLLWGNIDGVIEDQKDLINFIDTKWEYSSDLSDEIIDIKSGLDYAIKYVSTFKSDSDTIEKCKQDIITITDIIDNQLQVHLSDHDKDIEQIKTDIEEIEKAIEQLNQDLININVDPHIENWISNNQSDTIKLSESGIIVNVLEDDNNAIKSENGLFVKDFSEDIQTLQSNQQSHSDSISELQDDLNKYKSNVPVGTTSPYNIGGISSGTVVDNLNGKNISEIIDAILFPAYVEPLKSPTLYYSNIDTLVEVNSTVIYPELIFTQNHAGTELPSQRTNMLTYNGTPVESYSNLGDYIFKGSVSYNEGDKLINNRGEVTDFYIPAGTLTVEKKVTTTYPWYFGNSDNLQKFSTLIPFNINSGNLEFYLSGKGVIKLPGSSSTIISFQLDGGLGGFMDVNMAGWIESEEEINGIKYKVYEKSDSYLTEVKHQINFKLEV